MRDVDYSSYSGCMELVDKIRRFWARKGLFPNVWAEKVHTTASRTDQPTITYQIASDMVGGWPQ